MRSGLISLKKFEGYVENRALGAGEGNRTLVVSLGSFYSTIELHPHMQGVYRPLSFVDQVVTQNVSLAHDMTEVVST